MTRIKNHLWIAATLLVLAVVGTLMNTQRADAQNPGQGSASVSIISPVPLPVKDADHPDRNPFRVRLCAFGANCGGFPSSFTAPPDKNVIIDVISGECLVENGVVLRPLTVSVNGTILHLFAPNDYVAAFPTHTRYQWNKQTRLHVPANGNFLFEGLGSAGPASCDAFLSGYTVSP